MKRCFHFWTDPFNHIVSRERRTEYSCAWNPDANKEFQKNVCNVFVNRTMANENRFIDFCIICCLPSPRGKFLPGFYFAFFPQRGYMLQQTGLHVFDDIVDLSS